MNHLNADSTETSASVQPIKRRRVVESFVIDDNQDINIATVQEIKNDSIITAVCICGIGLYTRIYE